MFDEFGCNRIIKGVTHCFFGGSQKTSTTQNQASTQTGSGTTANQYIPAAWGGMSAGYRGLRDILPGLVSRINQGLTPSEKSYYSGNIERGVAENVASQTAGLKDQFARLGGTAGRGAEVEALSNVARGGVQGTAQGLSNLAGLDINQKQTNLSNLMQALAFALNPTRTGSAWTQTGTSTGTGTGTSSTQTNPGLVGILSSII